MTLTVSQLVEWILANRKGTAFNYEPTIIYSEVCNAIKENVFVCHEVEGQIQGVVCGRKDEKQRVVHIYDVLVTRRGVIQKFMERFLLLYPEYTITGTRKGKFRIYNNPFRLAKRLTIKQESKR